MIYRLKELKGDTIAVPQLVFSKLGIAEEYNVRVALYAVPYNHLRAHETPEHLVCRLLLEKKKKTTLSHLYVNTTSSTTS